MGTGGDCQGAEMVRPGREPKRNPGHGGSIPPSSTELQRLADEALAEYHAGKCEEFVSETSSEEYPYTYTLPLRGMSIMVTTHPPEERCVELSLPSPLGWACPKCGCVWAPHIDECRECNKDIVDSVSTYGSTE